MTAPHVRLEGVSRGFGDGDGRTQALEAVSLAVARQEVVVLLGPSGCGKTTLLRLVAGLIAPDAGRVTVDGRPPEPGREAAMVFQSFRLIPWKTARENIAFALPGLPRAEALARADRYLALVGLSRFAKRWPAQLSGGMRQRLALARALAAEPQILLMDEPFASLDAQSRELMQVELMRLMAERPATVLFVTHSVDEALMLADRIVLMSPRPGRIVEEIAVPFPRPRWEHDARALPDYVRLRRHLWERLRDMVLNDPASDFHGRR
ncbi:ABC transporter ATP-binding protein [Cereibacter sphaeroides]|uniref:ABC transporter ATP-binding protein n=1 Tax=Cereibacter sphaeroides TaxID=1063 RepID=UPI001F310740|nr:ABC transporter ATP-binding protein [Cereibacter sphaeroides]MCE6953309.1 ABC transporter ATP-binding protein [Cereibacter sphaeroides]